MRPLTAAALILFALPAFAAEAKKSVIAPVDRYHSHVGSLWVVVRENADPEIILDGKKAVAKRTIIEKGVRHYRIEGLNRLESSLSVKSGGETASLKILGVESDMKTARSFHQFGWGACSSCHSYEPDTCIECHDFDGHKHATYLKCESCHKKPGYVPVDTAPLCAQCHPEATAKFHKKLKHSLAAAADPRRPGKNFDCVSCHSPHAPKCLSGLKQGELREWCKGCHAR